MPFGRETHGFLKGAIDEARIYNAALEGGAIARLKPGIVSDPKPVGCWTFDDGIARDVMGHYPVTQLIGTARVRDGALVLDGRGYALVSSRLIAGYAPQGSKPDSILHLIVWGKHGIRGSHGTRGFTICITLAASLGFGTPMKSSCRRMVFTGNTTALP